MSGDWVLVIGGFVGIFRVGICFCFIFLDFYFSSFGGYYYRLFLVFFRVEVEVKSG